MSKEHGGYVSGAFWSLSPVVAITSVWDGKINGQIAVTVVNASILHAHPRLILGIWKGNYTHDFIAGSGKLAVHLLRKDQIAAVKNFGFYTGRERDKFSETQYKTGRTGCPILLDCHSYAECEVINKMDGGDMSTFLANVVYGEVLSGGEWMTLSHFYTQAPPEWIAQYEERLAKSVELSVTSINDIDYSAWRP